MKGKSFEWIKKHKIALLTVFSGIIGAIFFILIYGTEVLNVTNDAWLCNSEDLTQHYLGWVFFRKSNWNFPIRTFQHVIISTLCFNNIYRLNTIICNNI